jgi:hypothetical protein
MKSSGVLAGYLSGYPTNQELRFEPPGPEPESKSYLLKFASSRWLPLKGIVPLPLKPIELG